MNEIRLPLKKSTELAWLQLTTIVILSALFFSQQATFLKDMDILQGTELQQSYAQEPAGEPSKFAMVWFEWWGSYWSYLRRQEQRGTTEIRTRDLLFTRQAL